MIISMKPISIAEVKELVKDVEEKKELKDYLKKFGKIEKEDAEKMRESLSALNNMKLKEEDIVKILDFMPKNSEELNKIFTDVSLDEKETNEILEIIKQK